MDDSAVTRSQLTELLRAEPQQTLDRLAAELHHTGPVAELCAQAGQLQMLVDRHTAHVHERKAVHAAVGRARRAGKDTQHLITESRQLSHRIESQARQIDDLVSTLAAECLALKQRQASCEPANAPSNTATAQPDLPEPRQDNPAQQPAVGPARFNHVQPAEHIVTGSLDVSDETSATQWNNYVNQHPFATHYHQYEWRELIRRNFRQQTHYLSARDSSTGVVGVISAVHLRSLLFGPQMISAPFLIYGGPLVDHRAADEALVNALLALSAEHQCVSTQLRETRTRTAWPCNDEKVSMVVTLPPDVDVLNRNFSSKLRSQVRRAAREKPHFHFGGMESLDDFYAVFCTKMRDHGTPVYAKRFFRDILQTFPESTFIATVRQDNQVVAAALLISYRDTLEIPWAASLRASDRLGMNMFMYHSLFEHAVTLGFRYFDMGRSTKASPTWRFKQQWGATERPLYWHTQKPQSGLTTHPSIHTHSTSTVMRLATSAWRRLPLTLANHLGPILARQLPW